MTNDDRFWADDAPRDLPGVDGLWRFSASSDPRALALDLAQRQFVPPDACADLIVRFEAGRFADAFLVEPAERYAMVEIGAAQALFGVRFELGFGGAALRLRERLLERAERLCGTLLPSDATQLHLGLARLCADFVQDERTERPVWLAPVLSALRARCGNVSIAALSGEAGVNERTLLRGFNAWVGASPKLVCRTLRVRAGVELAPTTASLADLAATLGYADQAHFSREVRELWGTTPAALRVGVSDFFKTASGAAT